MNEAKEKQEKESVKIFKFEPKPTKEEKEEEQKQKGFEELIENFKDTQWESVFIMGFTKDEELKYMYTNYSVYEVLGMLEAVKFYFMAMQQEADEE